MTTEPFPPGYTFDEEAGIVYGSRVEGCFELKMHRPKQKNASHTAMNLAIARVVKMADEDPSVKCILFHGGKFFSAGNDLQILTAREGRDPEQKRKEMMAGMLRMKNCLM